MILEWAARFPIDELKLQYRGNNLYGNDWAERVVGTLTSLDQLENKITVISGPAGKPAPSRVASLQFVIDGGGHVIIPGQTVEVPDVPFNCKVLSWTLTGDQIGTAQVTICRASFSNYPNFEEISGTEQPFLNNAQKNQDEALTTWNTELVKGDVLKARIDSATNIQRLHIGLRVQEK